MLAMFFASFPFLSGYQPIPLGIVNLPENKHAFFNPYFFLWVTSIQVVFIKPPVGLGYAFVNPVSFHDFLPFAFFINHAIAPQRDRMI